MYTLTQGLLSGFAMDQTMFYQLLNSAKARRERRRDWVVLRDFDSSKSFTASDSYTSTKALPSTFLRVYAPYSNTTDKDGSQTGVYLVDSAGNKTALSPIPFARRFDYKDVEGKYYIDSKNNTIGRTGSTAGTLHLFYHSSTPTIDENATWVGFPDDAGVLLAYDVAVQHKGGIDWDTVNANQVPYNLDAMQKIESSLNMWDARLQQSEIGV